MGKFAYKANFDFSMHSSSPQQFQSIFDIFIEKCYYQKVVFSFSFLFFLVFFPRFLFHILFSIEAKDSELMTTTTTTTTTTTDNNNNNKAL